FEERGLDADAIDHPADRALVALNIVSEHADLAAIRDEQRRDQADERGFAGAVGPQQPEDLAALDGDVHVIDGDGHGARLPRRAALPEGLLPGLLLAESLDRAADLERRNLVRWQGRAESLGEILVRAVGLLEGDHRT